MKSIITSILAIFISIILVGVLNAEELKPLYTNNSGIEALSDADIPNLPQTIYYSIDGHVYIEGTNERFEGVTIEFSGGIGSVVTDNMGFYSVDVPRGWSGVATPWYCGFYSFTPEQMFYTNVKKDYLDQDYTGGPDQLFTISGRFTYFDTGDPISNTEIDFGDGILVTTNDQGEYSIEVLPCITDTLVPYLDSFNFDPGFRVYSFTNSNYINQDYEGTPNSFGLPPGWEYENSENVHIISVFTSSNPNLCGVPLEQGDYIGAFYTGDDGELHCGGAGMWTGISNTPVIAQGDDSFTPEKDGFAYGETMKWKVYRWTEDQKEYTAIPEMQCGGFLVCNNKWYITGLSIIEELNMYEEQFIEIPEGWSGFSSFLDPKSPLVTHTVAPIIDDLVIMQTLTKMYYPSQGINTIGFWQTYYGFKIKVDSDVVLPIMGCMEEDTQISLQTTWNIFPVLSNCNVQLTEFLDPVIDDIIVVKEIGGNNIFWPEMNIATLKTLLPGKAYMAAVSQNLLVTFPNCPGNDLKSGNYNAPEFKNLTHWNNPAPTATNHSIAIQVNAMQEFETGDFIGAFSQEGYCAGLSQITDVDQNQIITIFGNDVTTFENDGLMQDELISFKLYRPSAGKEFNLLVSYDQNMGPDNGLYTDNGLSAISEILFDPTNIEDKTGKNIVIFPNPTSGRFEIISGDDARPYTVNIYSISGSQVFSSRANGNTAINLDDLNKGIYIVKIETDDFVKFEKLILE
jgi:hypothetical protein